MKLSSLFVAFNLVAFAATSASAQEVRPAPGRALPTEVELDESKLGRMVWVASQDYAPTTEPGGTVAAGTKTFKFMEDTCLAAGTGGVEQKGNAVYRLLARPVANGTAIETLHGWIDERLLVMTPEALKHRDTTIYRKVMIVNTRRDLEQVSDAKSVDQHVQIRLNPGTSSTPIDPCRLFDVFFNWGETELWDGSKNIKYVLIGPDWDFPFQDPIEDRSRAVLGWVPADRVCHWSTRQAVDWDEASTRPDAKPRRLAQGHVWSSMRQAQQMLDFVKQSTPGAKPPVQPLSSEGWDAAAGTVALGPAEMRFPILEWTEQDKKDRETYGDDPDWALFSVGVVGDFVDADGKVIATKSEILKLRHDITALRNEMSTIEVLFVIDDTSSMREVFPRVADTVQTLAKEFQGNVGQNLRVAVAYYNDVPTDGSTKAGRPFMTNALAGVNALRNGKTVLEELRTHETQDGEDLLEMVFDGITRGIEDATFSSEATKLVILLGDAGDRQANSGDEALAQAITKVKVALGAESERPIDFYAIRVRTEADDKPGYKEAMQIFEKQILGLVSAVNDNPEKRRRAEYASVTDLTGITTRIRERFTLLKQQADALQGKLAKAERGQIGRTQFSQDELDSIQRRNPKFVSVLESGGAVQLFSPGYVWMHREQSLDESNPDAFRHCLLVNGEEVKRLLDPLDLLLIHSRSAPDLGEQALTKIVISQVGEGKNTKLSWDEHAKLKANGLEARSPLLNTKLESLNPNVFSMQELYDLERKRDGLEDVLAGKQFRYVSQPLKRSNGSFTRWERGEQLLEDPTGNNFNRAFKLGGRTKEDQKAGADWYWIDKVREWP